MTRKPAAPESAPDGDEEPLEGTWWDGADKDVRRILRDLRLLRERQAELVTMVRELPEVRKSKGRGRQLDTALAAGLRDAFHAEGIPLATIDKAFTRFLEAARPPQGADAVRRAVKRLKTPAPAPARRQSKRDRMDK